MIIKCPGCHTELDATEEMFDHYVRCSVCDTKFKLSLKTTIETSETEASEENAGSTDLDEDVQREIKVLIDSNGLGKYFKLFRFSPRSIKFIVIYNLSWFVLNLFVALSTHEAKCTCGILYFVLLFPLLKRRNWAWRLLLGLYYLTAAAALILLICVFAAKSTAAFYHLIDCVFTLIIDIPVFIALWRHSARRWASDDW